MNNARTDASCLFHPGQPLVICNADVVDDKNVPTELDEIPSISKEQIKQIIRATQQQQQQQQRTNARDKDPDVDLNISIFTIIKMMTMFGILASLVYTLNRDYNNVITIWFIRTFPRESSTFGLSLKNEL